MRDAISCLTEWNSTFVEAGLCGEHLSGQPKGPAGRRPWRRVAGGSLWQREPQLQPRDPPPITRRGPQAVPLSGLHQGRKQVWWEPASPSWKWKLHGLKHVFVVDLTSCSVNSAISVFTKESRDRAILSRSATHRCVHWFASHSSVETPPLGCAPPVAPG